MTIQEALQLGLGHHQAGRLAEAEGVYRQVLAVDPQNADAWHLLGALAGQCGHADTAIEFIEHALQINPALVEAHQNRGILLAQRGRHAEAVETFRRVLALKPNHAEAYNNLGMLLVNGGKREEGLACFRQAIEYRRDYGLAWNNLGVTLTNAERWEEALAACRRAVELEPAWAEAWYNLGVACHHADRLDEAIDAYRRAGSLGSTVAEGHLATALSARGEMEASIAAYRRALAATPGSAEIHSSLIMTLHYGAREDDRAIVEELERWNRQHAEPLRASRRPHANDRSPDRRLRIGYVSSDFRDHVVGRNVLPLLTHHDRGRFEVFAYAGNRRSDAITERFREQVNGWRGTVGMSDEEVAEQIRADGIDILVDLGLHTAGSRLLIFARKPVPVQVSFAGYPGSTGVETMDYRLTDGYLEPASLSVSRLPEALADKPPVAPGGERRDENICPAAEPPPCPPPGYRGREVGERAVRLPHSFWCFDPLDCGDLQVGALPALRNGFVTFGCLNNFVKVNEPTLRVWAKVMRQVEGSRLVILANEGAHRQRTGALLEAEGIDPGRVEFVRYQRQRRPYLELYRRIDVGLDTYPYNGHTTSLDSYWMGVPVVTLVGQTPVARAGWSQLSNLGMTELAAHMPEQFVEIAVGLARDLAKLAELRRTLRGRMEQSPLMDAVGFTRGIEAAYRGMWQEWCAGGRAGQT